MLTELKTEINVSYVTLNVATCQERYMHKHVRLEIYFKICRK